jgi:hypothetical protein
MRAFPGGHAGSAAVVGAALEALWRDPRRAITEDGIVCLVCGRTFRHLTNTHLAHHGFTSETYKKTVGYNGRRSLMAHAVRRRHAANAVRRGLAQLIRRRPIVADPALRARAGRERGHARKHCDGGRVDGATGRCRCAILADAS